MIVDFIIKNEFGNGTNFPHLNRVCLFVTSKKLDESASDQGTCKEPVTLVYLKNNKNNISFRSRKMVLFPMYNREKRRHQSFINIIESFSNVVETI